VAAGEQAGPTRDQSPPGGHDVDELGAVYSSDAERRRAEHVAAQTDLEMADIVSVRKTDDGRLRPELTDAAREDRARERFEDERVSSVRELSVAGNDAPLAGLDAGEDVRFEAAEDGVKRELSEEAKLERARENFEIERDPRRVMAGTERIPVGVEESDFRFQIEDGDVSVEPTDEALAAFIAQDISEATPGDVRNVERTEGGLSFELDEDVRSQRARRKAAGEDPLRDAEDFVATVEDGEVDVRTRQAPLFEDAREDLGLNPPEESFVFRTLQDWSKSIQSGVEDYADYQQAQDPTPGVTTEVGGRTVDFEAADRGETLGAGAMLNIPGAILDARTVASQGFDLSLAVSQEGLDAGPIDIEGAKTSVGVGDETQGEVAENAKAVESQAEAVQESYRQNPNMTTGAFVGAIGAGALVPSSGLVASRAVRRSLDRIETLGSQRLSVPKLTQTRVARHYDPDVPDEPPSGRFPGADNPALYRRSPDVAVRTQATRNRPEAITNRFDEAGVQESEKTADLYKAIEVEPESPGRGAGGFRSREIDTRHPAKVYEAEGAFFSPDLSPYFFGELSRGTKVSLRPGLPRLGDRPTALAARGRVKTPEGDSMRRLNQELREAEEPVMRTKPADSPELRSDEIEVVMPEGTELVDIGNRGLIESAARRVGIGSDFRIEIGGRRIPVRPVADPELRQPNDAGIISRLLGDERGQVGADGGEAGELIGPRRFEVSTIRDPTSRGVDRPIPAVGAPADSVGLSMPQNSASSPRDVVDLDQQRRSLDRQTGDVDWTWLVPDIRRNERGMLGDSRDRWQTGGRGSERFGGSERRRGGTRDREEPRGRDRPGGGERDRQVDVPGRPRDRAVDVPDRPRLPWTPDIPETVETLRRPRDEDMNRDDREPVVDEVEPFELPFRNPIASEATVLFGGLTPAPRDSS
jgi:hypothetical protein